MNAISIMIWVPCMSCGEDNTAPAPDGCLHKINHLPDREAAERELDHVTAT